MPDAAKTVLVVEDHSDNLQSLAAFLTDAGYAVHAAPTALAALKLWEDDCFAPHAAVIDLDLPDLSGWVLCRMVRAVEPACRCIALSGWNGAEHRQMSANAGFLVHLAKPEGVQQLIGWIEGEPVESAEG